MLTYATEWTKKPQRLKHRRARTRLRPNPSQYSISTSQISHVSKEESYVDKKGRKVREITMSIYDGKPSRKRRASITKRSKKKKLASPTHSKAQQPDDETEFVEHSSGVSKVSEPPIYTLQRARLIKSKNLQTENH